jgi:hypothetical protein
VLVQVANTSSFTTHNNENSLFTDFYYVNINVTINDTEKSSRRRVSNDLNAAVHELTISYAISDSPILTPSTASSTGNNLDIPVLIAKFDNVPNMDESIEFTLRVVNQTVDAKCFGINKFSGDLFLKCKIPFSALNQFYYGAKVTAAAESIEGVLTRVVEINCRVGHGEQSNVYLAVSFDLRGAVVSQLERRVLNNVQPVGLTLQTVSEARVNRTDELVRQYVARVTASHVRDSFNHLRKRLAQHAASLDIIGVTPTSDLSLNSSNLTHFNFDLVYRIRNFTSNRYNIKKN